MRVCTHARSNQKRRPAQVPLSQQLLDAACLQHFGIYSRLRQALLGYLSQLDDAEFVGAARALLRDQSF